MSIFCIYGEQLTTIEQALNLLPDNRVEKTRAMAEIGAIKAHFAITGISKADVALKLFDDDSKDELITDYEMVELADDMADDYLNQLYWSQIGILGERIKSRIEGEDEGEETE